MPNTPSTRSPVLVGAACQPGPGAVEGKRRRLHLVVRFGHALVASMCGRAWAVDLATGDSPGFTHQQHDGRAARDAHAVFPSSSPRASSVPVGLLTARSPPWCCVHQHAAQSNSRRILGAGRPRQFGQSSRLR